MTKKELLRRYIFFIIGLFINALGVSFITKASLGTSPISSIPYTLSIGFPFTMGQFTFVLNMILILGQIIFLGKKFEKIQLLQIPISFLFSFFIDLTMSGLSFLTPNIYTSKVIFLLVGCVILGFGISMEVIADVVMLSGEAFVKAISSTMKKEFGITKITFDATLTISACIISLILFHKVVGVREGTIVAALIVGLIAKFFNKKLVFIENMLRDEAVIATINSEEIVENERMVITIEREFGSGGHEIGKRIAENLGITFYDNNIISLVAQKSGFTQKYVEDNEEKIRNSFLYDFLMQDYSYTKNDLPPLDHLFLAQSKVIRDIASKESCVIVGRCADYILRDRNNCVNIFIHSDRDIRIKRIMDRYGVATLSKANIKLEKKDKERTNYYKRYTNRVWNAAENFSLSIDSRIFGIEESAKIISEIIKKKAKKINYISNAS